MQEKFCPHLMIKEDFWAMENWSGCTPECLSIPIMLNVCPAPENPPWRHYLTNTQSGTRSFMNGSVLSNSQVYILGSSTLMLLYHICHPFRCTGQFNTTKYAKLLWYVDLECVYAPYDLYKSGTISFMNGSVLSNSQVYIPSSSTLMLLYHICHPFRCTGQFSTTKYATLLWYVDLECVYAPYDLYKSGTISFMNGSVLSNSQVYIPSSSTLMLLYHICHPFRCTGQFSTTKYATIL